MAKRAFDIVLSLVFLVLLAPLAVVLAVLIKLETPGPIFTSRVCAGRHGRPFTLYHLRTMTMPTAARPPIRTPLGRALCNRSLNDYPMLWSVLTGTLSMVGPLLTAGADSVAGHGGVPVTQAGSVPVPVARVRVACQEAADQHRAAW